MSVERIFAQLHDRSSWPAPPPRVFVPADVKPLPPGELERWVRTCREISDGLAAGGGKLRPGWPGIVAG